MEHQPPLKGGGLLLFSLKIVYVSQVIFLGADFGSHSSKSSCLISPLAMESLPAALPRCPDCLGEEEEKAFSTSSCSMGSSRLH